MDSVLIVVLNWNNIADTERCLESLSKQDYKSFTILLVDNASTEQGTDAALSTLEATYGSKFMLLHNDHNKGFAGGVNTGIRYGIEHGFDYIALFNNDAVAEPDWLRQLVTAAAANTSALTTGLLLHEDGTTIDSTGDWYSIWGLPFPRGRNRPRSEAPSSGEVFGVSGGASLYKTDLFRDIGLFDEVFFAYYEDMDISFRAKLAGYTAFYTADAVAYHKQGATSSKIPGFAVTQTMKNLPLLYIKNVPTSLLFPIGVRFWAAYLLILGKALVSRNSIAALRGYLRSVWLFWIHALPQRFRIQSRRKVSASDIRSVLWHDLPPDQTGLRKLLKRENP